MYRAPNFGYSDWGHLKGRGTGSVYTFLRQPRGFFGAYFLAMDIHRQEVYTQVTCTAAVGGTVTSQRRGCLGNVEGPRSSDPNNLPARLGGFQVSFRGTSCLNFAAPWAAGLSFVRYLRQPFSLPQFAAIIG